MGQQLAQQVEDVHALEEVTVVQHQHKLALSDDSGLETKGAMRRFRQWCLAQTGVRTSAHEI